MAETKAGTEVPGDAHGAKGAFPPFETSTFASQILWLAIAFGLLYTLMAKVVLPRISGILAERSGKISADLAAAQKARADSDAAHAAYEQALSQAREKARGIASENTLAVTAETDAARKKTEAELARRLLAAESKIEATKVAALANVNAIAEEATSAIVEQLIGTTPDSTTVKAAVEAAVESR